MCALERRTARSGKDSIDHPPGGHDDVINAAAGALVEAAQGSRISVAVLEPAGLGRLVAARRLASRPDLVEITNPDHPGYRGRVGWWR